MILVGFDERKDPTLIGHSTFKKSEHRSVVLYCKDRAEYVLGSFTPEGGTGEQLAKGLYKLLTDRGIVLDHIIALNTDCYSKMVEHKSGALMPKRICVKMQ